MSFRIPLFAVLGVIFLAAGLGGKNPGPPRELTLSWEKNMLRVTGPHLPGKTVEIWYIEAYCRPGSTDRDWRETVIGHETELVSADDEGKSLHLRCKLKDGVVVDHRIAVGPQGESVDFQIEARNPTDKASEAHWAQPCIRVGEFTGTGKADTDDKYAYLKRTWVYLDGKPETMPTKRGWATEARYVSGQVWCPKGVDRNDVNPRPLSPLVPSSGLIGCTSADGKWILATAFEPYQELFVGVIRCLHSDFRIGGLEPGETKKIRGKLYLVPADQEALERRYAADFPEQVKQAKP